MSDIQHPDAHAILSIELTSTGQLPIKMPNNMVNAYGLLAVLTNAVHEHHGGGQPSSAIQIPQLVPPKLKG